MRSRCVSMIFSTHEHFDNSAVANQHIEVRPLRLRWERRSRASTAQR